MNLAAMDPTTYDVQLETKRVKLTQLFADFDTPELETFSSEPAHYRMRAEFRVWHEGEDLYYYMFDKELNSKVRCDQFLPASELINKMMPALVELLKPNTILRHRLFQIDFLSTLSGEILVSLLYHKQLDSEWEQQAKILKQTLSTQFNVNLIGRARKQKIIFDKDFVVESLNVAGKQLQYHQIENSFTQPNGKVSVKMLEWAIDVTKNSTGDLLELYCGNGNFSIALAQNFDRVLATELAKPSVESAQYNIKVNQVENLQIIRMSAEDFTEAMAKKRSFRRLEGIDLDSYNCNTIFVDPPRAGLDADTVKLVQGYERIVYISCNPHTLLDNLAELSKTHKITRFALFDQFPYTDHMESGVFLEKR
ncbi:tRNA (uracil-5-)-methyltransferase [Shewanella halifaxensis HAW-EB4]|uniref:tRNA/tmRNA (uracil-C(5))-methyltransferase n=1 Tax=Shewanella halifaxensis (strain HAW-EB4) TaxID=458817 RepID=TRMA_SHEHH|nr:tRNA (uridine(54)-C5)-methyltransferase TrmA [Shewanella halifaxensis]B0TMV6.1 RecName: Full=tRNA/tmRNA (uracil-C(5))-methyltransferase; AltName: Full=tRNA (uracil(54)-C(5))-methyltransferase; AltName: Full=tRNA(m5U54)-methyltransferase; Short=RUMT; AltName: Full=tmRNA (uracil(341)-C(5))-methyltransferase [Shewanella halifaxensis HAW-EB4]ABZ78694.1 tRNA (uracil-5-)-methyltransferase [Shewanella halifaxensis HAW-EB4]